MKALISEEIIKSEYPILGPSLMSKKYNVKKRYCICRASNLCIKFRKRQKKYCVKCKRELINHVKRKNKIYIFCTNTKSGLCRFCAAKVRYNKRGIFSHSKAKLWNKKEVEILEEKYCDSTIIELCNLLNRNWNSIMHKGYRLGLKRNPEFMKRGNEKGRMFFRSENNPIVNHMTIIEKKVANLLTKLNINYKFNEIINTNKNVRFPDFRIDKLIIECDGKYWHKDNKDKENERNRELIECGYNILHFSEDKINKNIDKVEKCILKRLEQLNGG